MTWFSHTWWKLRFAVHFYRLTRWRSLYGWHAAGSWLEMLDGDVSESPRDCVREEIQEALRDA